jgi:hypothetical protein
MTELIRGMASSGPLYLEFILPPASISIIPNPVNGRLSAAETNGLRGRQMDQVLYAGAFQGDRGFDMFRSSAFQNKNGVVFIENEDLCILVLRPFFSQMSAYATCELYT